MKSEQKEKAIGLRMEGLSYHEILKVVPVAKSTLSLWLRSVDLTKRQKQILTEKKRQGVLKGGRVKSDIRLQKTEKLVNESISEVKKIRIDKNAIMIMGVMLYWAEGAKQKQHNISQRVCFSNSDPKMVLIFLLWLDTICNVEKDDVIFELYIHISADLNKSLVFWERILKVDKNKIRVRFKRNSIQSVRKNTGSEYNGLIRIVVPKSTNLNRKITGWIQGIYENCPVVQW